MCGPGQPRNWNDDVHVVNMQAVGTPPLQSPMLLFYRSPVKLYMQAVGTPPLQSPMLLFSCSTVLLSGLCAGGGDTASPVADAPVLLFYCQVYVREVEHRRPGFYGNL